MAEQGFRVTYATMTADNEELHKGYDEGIEKAKKWLGQRHTFFVNGEAREGESWFEERSPGDHDLEGQGAIRVTHADRCLGPR